jgi:hypothetical protein
VLVVSFPWLQEQRRAWYEATREAPWKITISRDVHNQFDDLWDIVHPYDLAIQWGLKPGTALR